MSQNTSPPRVPIRPPSRIERFSRVLLVVCILVGILLVADSLLRLQRFLTVPSRTSQAETEPADSETWEPLDLQSAANLVSGSDGGHWQFAGSPILIGSRPFAIPDQESLMESIANCEPIESLDFTEVVSGIELSQAAQLVRNHEGLRIYQIHEGETIVTFGVKLRNPRWYLCYAGILIPEPNGAAKILELRPSSASTDWKSSQSSLLIGLNLECKLIGNRYDLNGECVASLATCSSAIDAIFKQLGQREHWRVVRENHLNSSCGQLLINDDSNGNLMSFWIIQISPQSSMLLMYQVPE